MCHLRELRVLNTQRTPLYWKLKFYFDLPGCAPILFIFLPRLRLREHLWPWTWHQCIFWGGKDTLNLKQGFLHLFPDDHPPVWMLPKLLLRGKSPAGSGRVCDITFLIFVGSQMIDSWSFYHTLFQRTLKWFSKTKRKQTNKKDKMEVAFQFASGRYIFSCLFNLLTSCWNGN